MNVNRFRQLLIELTILLRNVNAPILEILNPGIRRVDAEKILGYLSLPEEVFVLYEWKNGSLIDRQRLLGENWLFKRGIFMLAERAVELYTKKAGKDGFWNKAMFPLFESRGGDFYLIDSDVHSPTYRMIFFHSIGAVDYDTMISKYDSLETLFETILECFKTRIYHYDPSSKTLEFDPMPERNLSKKYNPKAGYWKLV